MDTPTIDNTLNPFSATLNKIAPQQAAPAADANATTVVEEAAPVVSTELLNKNTPAEETVVSGETITVQTNETVAELNTEPAKEVTPAPVIEDDPFFNDPLKNKPAAADPVAEATELAAEYKAMQNDPDFKLFMEYKKAGKSLGDLTTDFKYTDYNKMDSESLVKAIAAHRGYTPEEAEEALSDLNGLGKLSRDREIAVMKAELNAHQDTQRETLYGSVKQQAELQNKVRSQYATEVQQIGTEMIDKNYYGVKLDQEKQKDWLEFARSFTLMRQDGSVASEEIFKIWLTRLIPKIQSDAASKSHHQGKEEILKEVVRPVKEAPSGKLPIQASTGEVKHNPRDLTKQMTAPPSQRPAAV